MEDDDEAKIEDETSVGESPAYIALNSRIIGTKEFAQINTFCTCTRRNQKSSFVVERK